MAIKVTCFGCAKKFRTKDRYAGRRTKCPACGEAMMVPVPLPPTPNGQATAGPSRKRPTAARDVAQIGTDAGRQYISPPFHPDITAAGDHALRPARAGRSGFLRRWGSPHDPWYDLLSRSLGQASLGIGGALLIIGLPASQVPGGGVQGAVLIGGGALAALVAGSGLLLLADVARSLRRLSRRADREAGDR
jgi:hypothetical protein